MINNTPINTAFWIASLVMWIFWDVKPALGSGEYLTQDGDNWREADQFDEGSALVYSSPLASDFNRLFRGLRADPRQSCATSGAASLFSGEKKKKSLGVLESGADSAPSQVLRSCSGAHPTCLRQMLVPGEGESLQVWVTRRMSR